MIFLTNGRIEISGLGESERVRSGLLKPVDDREPREYDFFRGRRATSDRKEVRELVGLDY
jgi:hypothetical protein